MPLCLEFLHHVLFASSMAKLAVKTIFNIPFHHMPNPNRYEPKNSNKNKGTWFWDYGEEIDSSFNINYTDKIKFQVQSVSYPPIPVEQP